MVRLRLYDILALLPPKTYEGNALPSACQGPRDEEGFIEGCLKAAIFLCRQLQCPPEGAGGGVHFD